MTTLPTTLENNNNIPSHHHTDDYERNCMSMKEVYERTSSSSSSSETDQNQSQASSSSSVNNPSQKILPSSLVCAVCGAPASGYNFGQITCESCKAFFRRNALRNMPNLECRFIGSCVIDVETRRQCMYCRLKKCFEIKMRKEWIRTDEERELRQLQKLAKEQRRLNGSENTQQLPLNLPLVARKKKRLIIKPTNQDLVVKPICRKGLFSFKYNLSDQDRTILNNITNAYQLIDEQADSFRNRDWPSMPSIIEFMKRQTEAHESLINFYKLIPDFNQLDMRDRILLIKTNAVKMVPLHHALIYKFYEPPMVIECMPKWIGEDLHQRMSRAYRRYDFFIEHQLILKLALIIFIFGMNLTPPYSIDPLNDYSNRKTIHEIQEFYTIILWRYLNSLFDEREAIRSMVMIMAQMLHYQTLMNEMEVYIRQEPERNKFNELELSLFRLTT